MRNLKRMQRIDTIQAEAFRELLSKSRKIVTVSHTHPDGDALGSSLGMTEWLRSVGKEATAVFPDPVPATLRFMLDGRSGACLNFKDHPERVRQLLADCDLVICLDFPNFSRTETLEGILSALPVPKVLIDHHLSPDTASFSLCFSETEISSASELVFWVLDALGAELPLPAATALMTGMTTDTNNFSNSVWPSTFEMASRLLALGVDRDAILDAVNRDYEERRLRAMGCLLEQMTITGKGVAYMILDADMRERFGLEDGETEGFVNLPLSIKNVRMSIFLKETDGHFRVSIRSRKGTSARRMAAGHFHGGGHEQAAGGKLYFPEDIPAPADAAAYIERVTNEDLD